MSIATVHAALIAAVAHDLTLKVVESADVPQLVQKLPAAAVWYTGDAGTANMPTADGRSLRFAVRLYVKLNDLPRSQAALNELVDNLSANLEAHRALTAVEERITIYGGQIEPMQFGDGPILLVYTTNLTVERRPQYDVLLAVGADTVTIHDVDRENLPVTEDPITVLPRTDGYPVLYTKADRLELCTLAGRVDSTAEGLLLVHWYDAGHEISYTDRHGTTTTDWKINGSPAPRAESRAVAGEMYDVTLTLWRLP